MLSPERCRAASFSGKGGALRAGRESEWAVSWNYWVSQSFFFCISLWYSSARGRKERRQRSWVEVMTRAVASATELIQQLASQIYAIAVRITVSWHVSSLQLAGGSSESVKELLERMTRNSRVSKKESSFEWFVHESHIHSLLPLAGGVWIT